MRIHDEQGKPLRSQIDLQVTAAGLDIVVHSNGGASRGRPGQNPDYIRALELLLCRLRSLDASLTGIWVDSTAVAHLEPDLRLVRPGDRHYPIELGEIADIRDFRLEIRRSVARIGGRISDGVGTGNKRIRLSVADMMIAHGLLEQTLSGSGTPPSGYWLESLAATPATVATRHESVPSDLPIATGQLVVRIDQANPAVLDIWYVDGIAQPGLASGPRQQTVIMRRVTPTSPLGSHAVTGVHVAAADENRDWSQIDEAVFRNLALAADLSPDELTLPVPAVNAGGRGVRTRIMRTAAPIVRERISRHVERGPVGNRVKAASEYRCQLCAAAGLPSLGFPRIDDKPYVEAHHVVSVASLASDVLGVANVIAVCPNHHRQLHFGGVVATDEGDRFRFDFPFGQPTLVVTKSRDSIG